MTEEQKTRIKFVNDDSCCTFDGMPMHPDYRYYLICVGFKNLEEDEGKTAVFSDQIEHLCAYLERIIGLLIWHDSIVRNIRKK